MYKQKSFLSAATYFEIIPTNEQMKTLQHSGKIWLYTAGNKAAGHTLNDKEKQMYNVVITSQLAFPMHCMRP